MTPAESAVIADMLRGAKSDGVALSEETVARMLRAVDGRIEAALVFETTDHPRELRPGLVGESIRTRRELRIALGLSPAETPAGASVPRPQGSPHAIDNLPTNPALDPWHCVGCGARLCACPDGTARAPF